TRGDEVVGNAPNTGGASADAELAGVPFGGTRDEAMQRLQVGLSGLAAMVLLVGLASIIQGRALVSQETAVPEAAPTTEPSESAPLRDPLADAGVVPDLPVEPSPTPTQEAAIVPEMGEGLDMSEEPIDLLPENAEEQ
ncbi:MAG: hypothetical protein AAGL68_12285, partial [Pseudomonadota bacterium]